MAGLLTFISFLMAFAASDPPPPDIDALWEYSDPAASETRFREALEGSEGNARLELLTQVARTHSLRRQFEEAHRILDGMEPGLRGAGPRPRIRWHLERGRTFNSAGDKARAREHFLEAVAQAEGAREEGLAVDAVHMVAITHAGTEAGIEWNRRGLSLARGSADAKAQALVAAMLNNQAWDLHELGRYEEALAVFREAERAWTGRGRPEQVRIAKWSVARCLRSLGRHEEALAIQRALKREHEAQGTEDRFVDEEIAENLEALGRAPRPGP